MGRFVADADLDAVYDLFDRLFVAGEFGEADAELSKLDVEGGDIDLVLCHLTATLPAKGRLPSRAGVYERCWKRFGGRIMCGLK